MVGKIKQFIILISVVLFLCAGCGASKQAVRVVGEKGVAEAVSKTEETNKQGEISREGETGAAWKTNTTGEKDAVGGVNKTEAIKAPVVSGQAVDKNEEVASEKAVENEKVKAYIAKMSIEEKIGQLFMIAIRKDKAGNPITSIDEETAQLIKKYHVGGIILFKENIQTAVQTQALIADAQKVADIPLFIGVDEEGGMVSRVGSNKEVNLDAPFMQADVMGKSGDVAVAYKEAKRMGSCLKKLGFNVDFAPVADIYNEPSNTVIGKRSFGDNSQLVTDMVIAFSKGLKETGIQPVVKHFPGHGNTKQDSHVEMAYVTKDMKALEEEELCPFERAVEEGVGAMMKGHLIVPAVDPAYPASLSKVWEGYLAKEWDLEETLLFTDAMDMEAITKHYTSGEAACLSVAAGNDIILMPANLKEAYNGLLIAYKEGRLTQERIDASITKILSKKVAQDMLVLS